MTVKIYLKQIGRRKQTVAPVEFEYLPAPRTVRELIAQTVTACVKAYNERVRRGDARTKPLTEEQIGDMADVGKIAFGINYGGREQDGEKAADNALQSFEDGLYRVFLNDRELEDPDEDPDLHDGDSLTFIRLTMLSGRMY
ncbi:MAG: hypothetical protein NC123_01890 [Butyrivibrio sp.]|nr:hypothetical protein [Acetatifactor muris]MCM1558290.1 hypothetical protein [Butyrivibrio sp.]